MASITNRWAELEAGTLTPPVVVQHLIEDDGRHLYWVWNGKTIIGPCDRTVDDEAGVAAEFAGTLGPEFQITCEDGTVIEV